MVGPTALGVLVLGVLAGLSGLPRRAIALAPPIRTIATKPMIIPSQVFGLKTRWASQLLKVSVMSPKTCSRPVIQAASGSRVRPAPRTAATTPR